MEHDTTMLIFSLLLGLILGSFLNVCIHRIPMRESIIFPPSSCPKCGKGIRFYDNIPVLSYIILRGKCRFCNLSIPLRYPIVELISGSLSLFLFSRYGLSFEYFTLLLFVDSLVVISFIDLSYKIIPNTISLPGILLGFFDSLFSNHLSWQESFIGIIVGGGFLYIIAVIFEGVTGKQGMGMGDVKLLAMIGAWMGWKALPFIILVSSLTGSILGAAALLVTKKSLRMKIPFGPFLSFGGVIFLFLGKDIISLYIKFIL